MHLPLCFILTLVASHPVLTYAQETGPLPANQIIAGATQVEWSQRWWQWAFSFERARSPIADRTGQFCAARQSGEVWFLAGTYGTRRTVRSCKVPAGKHLFFPIINYVAFLAEGSDETCASLSKRVKEITDSPSALALQVNGVRYQANAIHRLASPTCFSLVPGAPADAASNGYFVMLPPLKPGKHVLEFVGVLPTMIQAVSYEIAVE